MERLSERRRGYIGKNNGFPSFSQIHQHTSPSTTIAALAAANYKSGGQNPYIDHHKPTGTWTLIQGNSFNPDQRQFGAPLPFFWLELRLCPSFSQTTFPHASVSVNHTYTYLHTVKHTYNNICQYRRVILLVVQHVYGIGIGIGIGLELSRHALHNKDRWRSTVATCCR